LNIINEINELLPYFHLDIKSFDALVVSMHYVQHALMLSFADDDDDVDSSENFSVFVRI